MPAGATVRLSARGSAKTRKSEAPFRDRLSSVRPVGPRPCFDPKCRGEHPLPERVALAASLCDARGSRLTPLRRQILEWLWERSVATTAYELIDALRKRDSRPVGPPTVYRALQFLMAQGLVTRIESRNAYIVRAHPERPHSVLLFICSRCNALVELENSRIENLLAKDAASLGYRVERRVIEVEGICRGCAKLQAPT
jgi:Fur family transcriptional regulator, zinc uptake regulator